MMNDPSVGIETIQTNQASGVVVKINPEALLLLLARSQNPLVVSTKSGIFRTKYKYLTSYKGIQFYAESETPLDLPTGSEVVAVDSLPVFE